MPNRDTRRPRQRARKQTGDRASSSASPRQRTRAPDAADEAQSTQAQLLHGMQQVWLAGIGAIARAQKEGPSAFSEAVFEGLRLLNQSRSTAQRLVRDALETAQGTLHSRVGGARSQAQETWDNLESLFQSRVQRAMHQIGVPTADEIRVLTRRVAELNENVKGIAAREPSRKTTARERRTATQRGRRKSARRRGAGE
ncbi:MAG: poly(hydroxyalcanoate) granule associated protein [Steroidobacteraceae bacterium]|nr:poly(hydroxyalcanoate) granule associated protein [Steroidobacteraceae bacterium]